MKKYFSIILCIIMFFGTFICGSNMFTLSAFAVEDSFSGTCGDEAVWCYNDSTNTLTIMGTGPINDIAGENGERAPWDGYKDKITTVIIGDGITSIGDCSFVEYGDLSSVSIPGTVTRIGNSAFFNCWSITSVTIPSSVNTIDFCAFYLCQSLTSVTVLSRDKIEIGEYAFEGCDSLVLYGYTGSYIQSYAEENDITFEHIHEDKNSDGKCDYCTEDVPDSTTHTHSWTSAITKQPTCTTKGEKTYTCSCNESYIEAIPATGHKDENSDGKCDICSEDISTTPGHTHSYTSTVTKQQTCTEKGEMKYTCTCGESYTEEIPAHTKGEPTITTIQELTCTQNGIYKYEYYCTVCKNKIVEPLTSDIYGVFFAQGHDIETHEAKEATCTEVGWDAYQSCKKCDYTTYAEIPKGHNGGVSEIVVTADNITTKYLCNTCGNEIPSVSDTDKVNTNDIDISSPNGISVTMEAIVENGAIKFRVKPQRGETISGSVIVARYDAAGKLSGIEFVSPNEYISTNNAAATKLFWTTDSFIPQSAAVVIK